MQLRDRFIVADPDGLDASLARAAQDSGAWALIDATRPGEREKLDQLDPARALVRVGLDAPVDPRVRAAVLSTWRIEPEHLDELEAAITAWNDAGVPAAVEVRTKEEGRRAVDAGADLLVARGGEGPGRVSERSNLVLLPALEELDVPLIAWGGAGPNATGALLVHADAVVLGAQLYLLDDAGLSEAWHRALGAFDGSDVKQLGNTLDEPYHVHARVADEHVHDLWEDEQASTAGPSTRRDRLTERIEAGHAGFDEDPGEGLRPLGHDAAHADFFEQFDGIEEALSFLEDRVDEQLDNFALEPGNEMAETQGTEYPVIQGAMANVSEIPAFAEAVADEGGLPFLAFAALREEWAREALEGTLDTLDDDQPFGCGIIGLDVNAEKRDAHVRLLKKHKPPYALIAAGTAEQALSLEEEGIDTFLHTPSRGIVRQALEMGLERVVVEGNECGGHIGKLPSLVLWDQALQEVDTQDAEAARVWLAGGIGDADTSAMAGTLAGATPAMVGALMGTAYLATEEIVDTGAIPSTYQDLVLAARDTHVTGRTTGIRSRSAPTPFTQRVTELEQQLVQQGTPLDERRERVERKSLGATRLAARRLKRGDDGEYHKVDTDTQFHEGQFLMGQGAELIEQRTTIADLHEAVTEDASDRVEAARERLERPFAFPHVQPAEPAEPTARDAVAVVGLGCEMPDASSVESFWDNLVEGHVSIEELPEDRWPVPSEAHYDPDSRDHAYTLLGAYIAEDRFDPIEYRIPPTVAEQMDPAQKWAVLATEEALEDAGLLDDEDRDRWAVILGNAQGGEHRNWSDRRMAYREIRETLEQAEGVDGEAVDVLDEAVDRFDPITEDTMPGELSNIIASRVCNVFDIGGPARTVDTACASSLAAAEEAVRQLRDGDVDVAITGGVDRSMHPAAFTKFSAIGALSQEGSFPFDERASGFVMGEGCGVLVLKRLADAVEDGDQVYALVEGVGSSSDGAGKGITAPNPDGQKRAIQRAWEDAALDPSTVAFVEAHGTGTPVGDPTEAQTLAEVLGDQPDEVALGSVKANVGHLKSAAGAAGLIKAVLALHTGTLPPTPVEQPTSEVDWDETPLDLALQPRELPEGPIRAGVSAFGFGGTNSHVVLAAPEAAAPEPAEPAPQPTEQSAGLPLHVLGGDSREDLAKALDADPETWSLGEDPTIRVAVHEDASREDAEKLLEGDLPPGLALKKGIGVSVGEDGQLGLVFPGQGSQYPRMLVDLADEHPAAREVLEEADQVLTPLIGRPISEILALEGEEGQQALTPTEICQPAVLACDVAILRVLEEHGVEPDVVAGHSLGEYAALVAAGALGFEDALHAVSARGQEMADVSEDALDDPGGLVAVRTGPDEGRELIEDLDAWLANINGPEQTVIAGTTPALETIQERADERDLQATELPVSAAFHSPMVAPATQPLREVLERIPIDPPDVTVIANATAEPYPEDPDAIRDLLAEQVASPVRWMETMERFDEMGVDLVVETGPKAALTGLARQNLPETTSVPTAHPRKGAAETLETALVALAAHGHLPVDPEAPSPATRPTATPARPRRPAQPRRATDGAAPPTARGDERNVVVSGVSLGAPTPDPDADINPFDEANRDALLAGENRIAHVRADERDRMADMGVTRLVKDDERGPRMVDVDDPDDVLHLAGRLPDVDLADYEADESWLEDADPTARYGVAAALEALTDARIPLVPDRRETSTGTTLTDGWVLPEALKDDTGVILASAFPGQASLVDIVEGHEAPTPTPAHQQPADPATGGQDGTLTEYLADLVPELDRAARKTALDLLVEHSDGEAGGAPPREATPTNGHRREAAGGPDREADFPRDFLFRTLAMGHAQIAQLVDARGPNMQLNTACASTTTALATAQDWIEQGRCERVIVVGVDVAGDETLLPWIGSGFLAAGAATTSDTVEEAAVPFDERRHGMLVGSGAVGLVVETEAAADERGVTPLAELVDTHIANSAYHGSRLEPDHVTEQVRVLIDRARETLDCSRQEMAEELAFVSHEPATPARGGSAEAEVRALREALGDAARDVLVTNTKGLTGHAMGAGIEDVTAVEILRSRRAPPVANLKHVDPDFQDLTFSQGGETDRSLSLRFAAGFGSQVALALFRRAWETPGALDEDVFEDWLARVTDEPLTPVTRSRCLRAVSPEEADADEAQPRRARAAATTTAGTARAEPDTEATPAPDTREPDADEPPATAADADDAADAGGGGDVTVDRVRGLLTELVSKKTGYPEDVIEADMDLEADLGVDTVKQAEVLSEARSELDIPPIEGLSLSEVPTLDQAARTLAEHAGADVDADAAAPATDEAEEPETAEPDAEPPTEDEADAEPATEDEADAEAPDADGPAADVDEVREVLLELVSKKTGYPEDVIEADMDLEADLGVDTVKQAEVLSEARSELDIPPIEGLSLSEVPTLDQAARTLAEHAGSTEAAPTEDPADEDAATDDEGPGVRVLGLGEGPAPAGDPLEDARVALEDAPSGLADALSAKGATPVDDAADADVFVLGLGEPTAEPGHLLATLERLQDVPEGTRVRLVADAGGATSGLPALAGTLTEEGWPTRAVLVDGPVPDERLAREVLLDVDAPVRLTPERRRTRQLAPTGAPAPVELPEGAVVLAPGGLGAAVLPCLTRLAEAHDVRLAVAGRSPIEEPTLDPDDEDQVAELRNQLLDEAREGEDPVRPAEVEEELTRRVKLARRAKALKRLEAVAETRYDRVDATDAAALRDWADAVAETWEAPSLVVHGAGLDDSQAFEDKDRATMAAVLDVKLTPVRVLADALEDAHHVAFGSIAGVAGNPGQADYALANGTLEHLLDPVDGTVLHWTAWDAEGGMADDDTIRRVLEERGVAFLDPEEGADVFLDWATTPGAFAVADRTPDTPALATSGGAHLELAGEEDWLADHAIGDRPLVPGVRHLQAMVEAARADGREVDGLSEVRFERPLWVTEPTRATVRLAGEDARVEKDGTLHARARLAPGDGAKVVPEETVDGETWTAEEAYEALFHGPSFQVLEEATVADGLAVATADLAAGGAAPWAMALEAGMQAAGLAGGDEHALPVGVEAIERGPDPAAGEATVIARRVDEDLVGATWDVTARVDGEVVLAARGVRLNRAGALPAFTDAAMQLSRASGADVRVTDVPPHDPRHPRAKRDAEREAGTEAAERAIEAAREGAPDVAVTRDEDGRPRPADGQGAVSITHSQGLAAAAAHATAEALGVDLERVEPRDEAWLTDTFTDAERARIHDHALDDDAAATLFWTLKEAASKALGTGLSVPTRQLEVTADGDVARVETPEGALDAWWAVQDSAVVSVAAAPDALDADA